jgi:hypothetical protein
MTFAEQKYDKWLECVGIANNEKATHDGVAIYYFLDVFQV